MFETTSGFSSVFSSVCKMSGFQDLKDLFRRRLLAAVTRDLSGQTTTCGYEEELHRQRKLLDVILTPEIKLRRADVLQLVVIKEELPPEQHERSPSLDQEDTKPPKIKEEQEELWSSQEGEQLQRPEQADTTMLLFSPLDVKSEDDEEKPQSSQLRYRQTEQIETVADGEDSGGAGPDRNSDSEGHLPPETEVKTEDSSEPETDISNDWKKGRERQSGLNSVENVEHKGLKTYKKSHSCSVCGKTFQCKRHMTDHIRIHTGEKPFRCSVCSKRFNRNSNLTRHMAIHRGEKSSCCPDCGKCFKVVEYMNKHMRIHTRKKKSCCPDCGKSFKENGYVNEHMRIHTGEKPFSRSVCKQRFFWRNQLKRHKCVESHALAAPQNQTEGKRNTQIGADVGDCGGVKPATNSEPERHLQPENQVKAEDTSDQKMNVCNDWKEAREQILGLNSEENITNVILKTEKKSHSCSVCGKSFQYKRHMTDHIRIHTREKPFRCFVCSKRFNRNSNLTRHMKIHRGERPFSCSVCNQRFFWRNQLKRHKCVEGHTLAAPQNQINNKSKTQTGADVGDRGGVKPATNSEPERHLQPENQVKAEDSSEQKMNVCNDWKEAREQILGLNSVENITIVILKTEKKSHSCSVCGKTFQCRRHMTDHIRIHTGEKPFRCSVCSKRFNRNSNLTRHMAIHRGEKSSCCPDCGKCFKVVEYMNKHMRIHTRKKKSCCPDGGKSFKENGYVNEHMRIHTGEKPFSCSVCKQRFFWRNQLKRHKCVEGHASAATQHQTEDKSKTQTGADVGDCGGVKPATSSEPERHLQPENQVKAEDSSEQKMNVCNDWKEAREQDLGLNSVENVTNVILKTEKKSHSCSVCGKSFQYKQHLKDHTRIHTGEKPFRCSVCSKSFNRKYNLTRHMTIHRSEKKSCCPDCGKSFKENGYVNEHMRIHTGEKPFSCSVCKQRFFWRNQLKRHKCVEGHASAAPQNQTEAKRNTQIGADVGDCGGVDWKETREQQSTFKTVGNIQNKKLDIYKTSHSCSECHKTFKKSHDLTRHTRVHTGEKPFNCSKCGKSFKTNSDLRRHIRIHKGEEPFSCCISGKGFNQAKHLTSHMLVHTEERPFSCSVTGKRSNKKYNLTGHMTINRGIKTFSCPDCGKGFIDKGCLIKHIRIHRGDKFYSCSVCDHRFFRLDQLKRHECVGGHALALPQNQIEVKMEEETGADGEDCGGAESARNSDPERQLQPEVEVKTEDSSGAETDDSDDWKETGEHQSGFKTEESIPNKRLDIDLKKSHIAALSV